MKSKWMVQGLPGGKFGVYRLKDSLKPDEESNRECAKHVINTAAKAVELVKRLNGEGEE